MFDSIEVCAPGFGDFDGDCDVDTDDMDLFRACVSGPAVALGDGCEAYDDDDDLDVDQTDFAELQRNMTGPK